MCGTVLEIIVFKHLSPGHPVVVYVLSLPLN
jgi:hypothetical protein